jgi:hypothetical protein
VNIKLKLPVFLWIVLFIFFLSMPGVSNAETNDKADGNYTFTTDWFTYHIPNWTRILKDMKGKPDLTYLEIGTWEGRSFFWVLDNILTHPSSKAIGIDTFDGDVEQRFRDNIRHSGQASKITVIKGASQQKLRELDLNSVDLIYIDGDHRSREVLMDAILSWDLLKENGILIFDDYKWFFDFPMEMRPEFAIDVFLTLFQNELQVLINDYQLIVRKTKTQCNGAMGVIKRLETVIACSHLGSYVYYWRPQKLYEASTNREFVLTKKEISLVENALSNLKMGFKLYVGKKEKDRYEDLFTRLGIREISVSSKE